MDKTDKKEDRSTWAIGGVRQSRIICQLIAAAEISFILDK